MERLEVDPKSAKTVDIGNIVRDTKSYDKAATPLGGAPGGASRGQVPERPNSEDFIDDPDVPPLL